jgi:putative ABC transport system substrate-binding protein
MTTLGDGQRMRRRGFIGLLGGAIAWPFAVWAQQAAKVARIGYLVTGSFESAEAQALINAFRQGLRERGYVEGQNILVEYRAADGKYDRLPGLARELVALNVDVIVAPATPAARAARQATATVPIVASLMQDPVGDGLGASLATPGGNITGFSLLGPELVPKRMELLKEALPNVSRVGVLWHPDAFGERTTRDLLRETETAAQGLGVTLRFVSVRSPDEFDRAFSAIATERADALLVAGGPMLFVERARIVDLAAKGRLPSMFNAREYVELGGLMSYGAGVNDLLRRSATFVDKILKGAKPGDLPVEQPTKFELVVNLKTMRELGLTISRDFLLLTDEVVE